MLESYVDEIRQEGATTRRVLERVPPDKLSWRPHEKSMSLGQLAMHIASIPAGITRLAQVDEFDASNANFSPPQPETVDEVLGTLDAALEVAIAYVSGVEAATATAPWRLSYKGDEIFTIPRAAMLRSLMLNHWYHHRGQMSVYLRLLDVAVPIIYGRSADETPFG